MKTATSDRLLPKIPGLAPQRHADRVPREAGNPRVSIRDMSFFYGDRRALTGVTLDVPEKSVTAIIGPSGCGKSTLIKSINRIAEIGTPVRVEGQVLFDGRDVYAPGTDLVDRRRRMGMLFQRPNPFPKSIFDNVAFGPRIHGAARRGEMEGIVEKSLRQAALWEEVRDRLDASAMSLSGGQQQRLCLARTLAMEPEVILLDEPTSGLDPISTAKIEATLLELKNDYTMVLVSNNTKQIARATDRVAFLLMSHIIEIGDTRQVFTVPVNQKTDDYISGRFG